MPQKHYYLFGLRVWSIVTDEPTEVDEVEDEPDGTNTTLDGQFLPAPEAIPQFGFTPWTPMPWGDYED